MAAFEKPPHHVGAHPTESDHSQLHGDSFIRTSLRLLSSPVPKPDNCLVAAVVLKTKYTDAGKIAKAIPPPDFACRSARPSVLIYPA